MMENFFPLILDDDTDATKTTRLFHKDADWGSGFAWPEFRSWPETVVNGRRLSILYNMTMLA